MSDDQASILKAALDLLDGNAEGSEYDCAINYVRGYIQGQTDRIAELEAIVAGGDYGLPTMLLEQANRRRRELRAIQEQIREIEKARDEAPLILFDDLTKTYHTNPPPNVEGAWRPIRAVPVNWDKV